MLNLNHDDIARRAYELYEARGREDGHDQDDWLQAERDLSSIDDAIDRRISIEKVLGHESSSPRTSSPIAAVVGTTGRASHEAV